MEPVALPSFCCSPAWLHHSGVMSCYSGRIEAVLYNTNEYLVSFDRPGLGKHHIPDTEVRVRAGLQSCSTHTHHLMN